MILTFAVGIGEIGLETLREANEIWFDETTTA